MLIKNLLIAAALYSISTLASAEKVVIIEMYGDSTTAGAQTEYPSSDWVRKAR